MTEQTNNQIVLVDELENFAKSLKEKHGFSEVLVAAVAKAEDRVEVGDLEINQTNDHNWSHISFPATESNFAELYPTFANGVKDLFNALADIGKTAEETE